MPGHAGSRARCSGGVADPPVPRAVRSDWRELAALTSEGAIEATRLDGVPAPARRWLARACPAGAPAARVVELATSGEIRIGRWRPFRARQVIAPGVGFVWAATVGRRPPRIVGFDRYTRGAGQMRWRLSGLVPVLSADGPDVDRSAAGRLAGESTLLPSALLVHGVSWSEVDDERAVARIPAGGRVHPVTVRVDGEGVLREVSMPRWGSPGGGPYREAVFRVTFDGEVRSEGIALPAAFRAGWDDDPGGEFMRCAVDDARVR